MAKTKKKGVKDINGFKTDDLIDLSNTVFPKSQIICLIVVNKDFLKSQSILDERIP